MPIQRLNWMKLVQGHFSIPCASELNEALLGEKQQFNLHSKSIRLRVVGMPNWLTNSAQTHRCVFICLLLGLAAP